MRRIGAALAAFAAALLGVFVLASPAQANYGDEAVQLSYSTGCGSITLTTVSDASVGPTWFYGLHGVVDGTEVVKAVQQGPGTKTATHTFAEDENGGTVDVIVSVLASTEQDLLPAEWPYGKEVTVQVKTDCIPPQPNDDIKVTTEFDSKDCDKGRATDRVTTTTTPYVWDPVKGAWVLGQGVDKVELVERDATEEECPAVEPSPSTEPGETATTTTKAAAANLPVTGASLGGVIAVGASLIIAGAAALLVLRRRRANVGS